MKRIIEKNIPELEKLAAAELARILAAYSGKPILLLLAGGSALEILKYLPSEAVSSWITIGMSDERFSADPAVNNFSQLMATEFYVRASTVGAKFLDSRPLPGEDLHAFGLQMEDNLWTWIDENPEGKVVVTFGIGADGHTAGMMPYPEDPKLFAELFESDIWYAAYDAGAKDRFPERGTITMTFIRKFVKERIVFVVGESKHGALKKLFQEGPLSETPARIHEEGGEPLLFTDLSL